MRADPLSIPGSPWIMKEEAGLGHSVVERSPSVRRPRAPAPYPQGEKEGGLGSPTTTEIGSCW